MAIDWSVDNLTDGNSWEEIKAGWRALGLLILHTRYTRLKSVMDSLKMDSDAYELYSWEHPLGAIIPSFVEERTPEKLVYWAARHNLKPKRGFGAWEYLRDLIEGLTNEQ